MQDAGGSLEVRGCRPVRDTGAGSARLGRLSKRRGVCDRPVLEVSTKIGMRYTIDVHVDLIWRDA